MDLFGDAICNEMSRLGRSACKERLKYKKEETFLQPSTKPYKPSFREWKTVRCGRVECDTRRRDSCRLRSTIVRLATTDQVEETYNGKPSS